MKHRTNILYAGQNNTHNNFSKPTQVLQHPFQKILDYTKVSDIKKDNTTIMKLINVRQQKILSSSIQL